jgi:hypothetical protein
VLEAVDFVLQKEQQEFGCHFWNEFCILVEPFSPQTIDLTVKGLDRSLLGSTFELTFIPWLNVFFFPSFLPLLLFFLYVPRFMKHKR